MCPREIGFDSDNCRIPSQVDPRGNGVPKTLHYSRARERKRPRSWKPFESKRRWRGRLNRQYLAIAAIAMVVVGLVAWEFTFRAAGCNIKGNISSSGERIYHVPGQEYYSATRINWLRGERWFCSENAARQAGWRKARI
jgi:hypothetical protein